MVHRLQPAEVQAVANVAGVVQAPVQIGFIAPKWQVAHAAATVRCELT
jgi:hypothetical protein